MAMFAKPTQNNDLDHTLKARLTCSGIFRRLEISLKKCLSTSPVLNQQSQIIAYRHCRYLD